MGAVVRHTLFVLAGLALSAASSAAVMPARLGAEDTTFTITATAGTNGTISPGGSVLGNAGATQVFTMTPDPSFRVDNVIVDGVSVGRAVSYPFLNVATNHTISVTFVADVPESYTISATASPDGTISPSGSIAVDAGGSQAFLISASSCHHIADVMVDGASVGPVAGYTFVNVANNRTISASFAIDTHSIASSSGPGG